MSTIDLFALNDAVAAIEASLATLEGPARLDVLIVLAWQLRQRDCKRCLMLADEAEHWLIGGDPESGEHQRALARLSLARGEVRWLSADLEAAEQHANFALAGFEHLADRIGAGDAKWLLVSISADRGNTEQRDTWLTLAIQDYRAGDERIRLEASAARELCHSILRDVHAASTRLEHLFDPTGHYHASVTVWLANARATIASFTGDPGAAVKYYLLAHRAALESGQLRAAIVTATNCAAVFSTLGDLEAALEWNERALGLARDTGWPSPLSSALMQSGHTLHLLERHGEAQTMLGEALTVRSGQTGSTGYVINLQYLGELMADVGDFAAALGYFEQAEECAATHGMPSYLLQCWNGQAKALCGMDKPQQALTKAQAALTLAIQEGSKADQIEVLRIHARLHLKHELPSPDGMTSPSATLHYLQQARAIADDIPGYILPSELLDEIANAYAACGDYRQAFAVGQTAAAARNNSRLESARNRAIAMQVRHETERAHAEAEYHRQLARTESARAETLQQASATLETLGLIGREITANLHTDAVFATLCRHVSLLLDVTSFCVYLLDTDAQQLIGVFGVEDGKTLSLGHIRLDAQSSFTARCARDRQEIALDTMPSENESKVLAGSLATRSLLFAPLLIGQKLLGVMTIQSIHACAYGERERSIFRTLCAYSAIALDNAAAYLQSETTLQALRVTQTQLEEAITTDPLTGLRNRRFLLQHIEDDVAIVLRRYHCQTEHPSRADATDMDLIFFMVDLDHFKLVNDTYGHAAGDMVLVQMRERLQEVFRVTDYLIRWGGEEFLLVARGANRAEARVIAERIRVAVSSRAFELAEGLKLAKTCSIGFASFPFLPQQPRLLSWTQVVEFADLGLYMAKEGGRNGWRGLIGPEQPQADNFFQRVMRDPNQVIDAGLVQIISSA